MGRKIIGENIRVEPSKVLNAALSEHAAEVVVVIRDALGNLSVRGSAGGKVSTEMLKGAVKQIRKAA